MSKLCKINKNIQTSLRLTSFVCNLDAQNFDFNIVKNYHDFLLEKKSNETQNADQKNNLFKMILPPPNVTGNLHIGHALTVTIEDAICRYHKFIGDNVIWYPGFDHAGIATQTVVENYLFFNTGKLRQEISKKEFVDYCEQWKNEKIKQMSYQLKFLGADLNWNKTFYTLNNNFARVVQIAFCRLFKHNLIFRDKRKVNWSIGLESTVSDQEVEIIDNQKFCSRSKSKVIEIEKDQWFLRCDEMHDTVLKSLKNNEINIKPKNVESKLVEWLLHSEPWCLSRQLLWGHKIPAYFDTKKEKWFVVESETEAEKKLILNFAKQDTDVLDTWFSSALLPLFIAGWPEKAVKEPILNLMETGHDIVGFWVARMLMLGKQLTSYFPFTNVVLHGLIRDNKGRKMSKSLGNVIDPMDVINGITSDQMINRLNKFIVPQNELENSIKDIKENYSNGIPACGTDALRFAFLRHNLLSLDVNIDIIKTANEGRRFCNKLWHLAKFVDKFINKNNIKNNCLQFSIKETKKIEDLWILSCLENTLQKYHYFMKNFEPHSAFEIVHKFFLHNICDIYVELSKPAFWNNDKQRLNEISIVYQIILGKSLKMLSAFMPYISNYLINFFLLKNNLDLELFEQKEHYNPQIEKQMDYALAIISAIRSFRNELNLSKNIEIKGILLNEEENFDLNKFCYEFNELIYFFSKFSFLELKDQKLVLNNNLYPYSIYGYSSSLKIALTNDKSLEIKKILLKKLQSAQKRCNQFENNLETAKKLLKTKLINNSNKSAVTKEINKLKKSSEQLTKKINGIKSEIIKLNDLISLIDSNTELLIEEKRVL